ncbi:MAG: LysM peptidoglycan-binding domain-containing protein [Chloroflexi bacterium]|nr:MAG: LysM peptidoglycan-binding domain-containing protein [Chloroflexota bacterium]
MKGSRYFSIGLMIIVLVVWVTAVSATTAHLIKRGETLSGIAAQYGVSLAAMMQANPQIIDPNMIYADDVLIIPVSGATGGVSEGNFYIVQAGDWMWKIAKAHGTTLAVLDSLNPQIADLNLIYPGDKIILPNGTGGVPESLSQPPVTTSFGYGVEINNFDNVSTMLDMENMTWVKMEIRWTPGDSPGLVAGDIQRAHDYGYKIILSIIGKDEHPQPGSIEFSRYVDFVQGVAELDPDAIEVWNEMNLEQTWPKGEISPTQYVDEMLKPTYNAIKGVDNDIVVIAGGLASTGYHPSAYVMDDGDYVDELYDAGAAEFMDCMGVHYKLGATSPNQNSGHPADVDHHSWYFMRTLDRYRDAFGGIRPLCITELGYLSSEGVGELPNAYAWAKNTTLANQATWLKVAIEIAKNRYNVDMVIVYNLDFVVMENTDPQAGYAIMRQEKPCLACTEIPNAVVNP